MLRANDGQLLPRDERRLGSAEEASGVDALSYAIGFTKRQKWIVLLLAVFGTSLGVVFLLNAKPNYTATATVLIDTRKFQISEQPAVSPQLSLESSAAMETQLEVFQSEEIALAVIKKLGLSEDPEFTGTAPGLKATLFGGLIGPGQPPTEAERVERARTVLGKRLTVNRVGITYTIDIGFESSNADRAAQVANAVVEAYVDQQQASQYNAIRQASDWLGTRIRELREQSESAQRAVVEYKVKNNIVETGGGELVNQRLLELNSQLATAHAKVIEAKARFDQLDAIARADGSDSIVSASIGDDAKNEILNKLRLQYLDLANRETEWSAKYGRDHLAVVNLRNQMLQIRAGMLDQFKQLKESARSELELAESREAGLQNELAKTISKSEATSQAQVALHQLEASARTYQALYDSFLNRYTDSVQEQTSPIAEASFINRARPPNTRNYKKTFVAAAAFPVAGLALGFGIALLRELRSRVFWTSKLVESTLRIACLGILPFVKEPKKKSPSRGQPPSGAAFSSRLVTRGDKGIGWTVVDEPLSRFSEGIRSIRLAVDTGANTKSTKVIGFTSALPNEGKSTVATAFGQLVARTGARVIVVDCDLRNPSLTKSIAPDAKSGILELVAGQASLCEVVWTDQSTQMDFLPAVLKPELADSYDILGSDGMKMLFDDLRGRYEFVVVDLSPLAPVIDVCATMHLVDSYILVIEWGRTKMDIVEHALRAAPAVYQSVLGAILNKVDIKRLVSYEPSLANYYYNKQYLGYGYHST